MGQIRAEGATADAKTKYATGAASVTNGGASCASRGDFFLGKIVFFNTHTPTKDGGRELGEVQLQTAVGRQGASAHSHRGRASPGKRSLCRPASRGRSRSCRRSCGRIWPGSSRCRRRRAPRRLAAQRGSPPSGRPLSRPDPAPIAGTPACTTPRHRTAWGPCPRAWWPPRSCATDCARRSSSARRGCCCRPPWAGDAPDAPQSSL
mmetsp:Transcript_22503/g.55545  ORF Transcript_22503/g.55545 Transcript_22503/m.55545 type:complete len:206 (-) Transcript_22503:1210-1827(-)